MVANLGGRGAGRHRGRDGAAGRVRRLTTTTCRCRCSCRRGAAGGGERLMDFAFSDEQLAVSEAATGVFSGLVDPERIAAVEAGDERIDRELWRALADADLLGPGRPRGRRRRRLRAHGALPAARGAGQRGGTGAAVGDPRARARCRSRASARRRSGPAGCPAWWPATSILTAALTGSAASPTSTPPCVRGRARRRWLGARRHRAGGAPGPPGGPHRRAGPHARTAACSWRSSTRRRPASRSSAP